MNREEQIRALFPLVKKIARRVHRLLPNCDPDDLIGEGSLGLIRAVDSYDSSRGPTLETYAARLIAGDMLNGVRRLDPVSERVRREVREADRERYELAVFEGSVPTQLQMEKRRPALKRATLHAYRHAPLSLDSPLPLGENLSADWSADPALLVSERSHRESMRNAIGRLSERQRLVLRLHYFNGASLRQIGKALSISSQRASQLHLAALAKLRSVMHVTHRPA